MGVEIPLHLAIVVAWFLALAAWFLGGEHVRSRFEKRVTGILADLESLEVKQRELTEALEASSSELTRVKLLADAHIGANQSFEEQRNEAWKKYHLAGIQAGNAQAMLLRSLEGAVRQLNVYRAKAGETPVEVNEGLKAIVSDFKREHGE